MTLMDVSPLINESQAAEILGLKPNTLSVWRCTGRHALPFVRVGRSVRYRIEDLRRWMEQRTENAPELAD